MSVFLSTSRDIFRSSFRGTFDGISGLNFLLTENNDPLVTESGGYIVIT